MKIRPFLSITLHKTLPKSEFVIEDIDQVLDPDSSDWKTLDAKDIDPEEEIKTMFTVWLRSKTGQTVIDHFLQKQYDIENISKYTKVAKYLKRYKTSLKAEAFVKQFSKDIWRGFDKKLFQYFRKYFVDTRKLGTIPELAKYIKNLIKLLNS